MIAARSGRGDTSLTQPQEGIRVFNSIEQLPVAKCLNPGSYKTQH